MRLLTLNPSRFKKLYFGALIVNSAAIAGAWLLVLLGAQVPQAATAGKSFTLPVMVAMIVLALAHTIYQRRSLAQLQRIGDFDERVVGYERFYRVRMLWSLLSCLVSCALAICTGRMLFVWFALYDLAVSLPLYPTRPLIRRELAEPDIDFCS